MKNYELIFIGRQDISPTQVESLTKQIVALFVQQKEIIKKTEYCGLLPLAYPIKKNKKGHYVRMNVTSSAKGLEKVTKQMHLNEDILRHLFVIVDTHEDGASVLYQQSRTFRDHIWDVQLPQQS